MDGSHCPPPPSAPPAVILPTVWRYLQTLDAAPYFLGLVLSAFSLSGLLAGPLFGHWSDRTRTTKNIILFANLFEIIGEPVARSVSTDWLRFLPGGQFYRTGLTADGSLKKTIQSSTHPLFFPLFPCRKLHVLYGLLKVALAVKQISGR